MLRSIGKVGDNVTSTPWQSSHLHDTRTGSRWEKHLSVIPNIPLHPQESHVFLIDLNSLRAPKTSHDPPCCQQCNDKLPYSADQEVLSYVLYISQPVESWDLACLVLLDSPLSANHRCGGGGVDDHSCTYSMWLRETREPNIRLSERWRKHGPWQPTRCWFCSPWQIILYIIVPHTGICRCLFFLVVFSFFLF